MLICIFSLFSISNKNYSRNFNKDILCSVLAFVPFFAFVVLDVGWGAGWNANSNDVVGILSKFFIGNILLLKLLRNASLALKNNPKLFKKSFFGLFLFFYEIFLIQWQIYITCYQQLLMINFLPLYLLNKQ